MLHPATLTFLTQLKANNDRAWFEAHRPAYQAAKDDFLALATRVLADLAAADPTLARSDLQAKKCVFRINRDVRFSANKAPYKNHFGAWFNAGGKAAPTAGYYLHLEPGASFVAGGMYMPEPAVLARVRQEIDYDLPAFEALLHQPEFVRHFAGLDQDNRLQRPPKGYDAANPALPHLKLKSFTASHPLPDAVLTAPGLPARVGAAFTALRPLVDFLNRAVE